jgi:hypothetical protein
MHPERFVLAALAVGEDPVTTVLYVFVPWGVADLARVVPQRVCPRSPSGSAWG